MLSVLERITSPIFYVTNDVAKGLGLEELLPNYHIVCIDDHPLIDYLIESGVNVFCLEREIGRKNIIFRSSGKLLENPLVKRYIKDKAGKDAPWIMYFKPSAKIDNIRQKQGYRRIGNDTRINRIFEDKISFYRLCQKWDLPVPPGEITDLTKTSYSILKKKYGENLVVQSGRGWAGSTTYFVDNQREFNIIKEKFGSRVVKITKYVEGKTLLNNCCVTRRKILVGPPAEQIAAIPGFTAKKGGTCGRSWPAGIDKKRYRDIEMFSKKIGEKMRKRGYFGYFGLDFLVERKTGTIYVSENNARLTASVPFYSKLEIKAERTPLLGHHVLTFLKKATKRQSYKATKMVGSEVVVRNDKKEPVLAKGSFESGVYRIENRRLKFVRKAYDIEGVRAKNEFFLTTAAKGRIVNPEMEMVRLNTPKNILDANGQPKRWVIKTLSKVKKNLVIRN